MLKRFVSALVVMGVCLSIAMAEEIRALITKIDGDKVTFKKMMKKEVGEEQTLSTAAGVKVLKGKFNPDTKKVEEDGDYDGGLKTLSDKLGEKGKQATIITDDDKKITKIILAGKKKKDN